MKLNPDCLRDVLLAIESLAGGEDSPWLFSDDLPPQLLPYTFEELEYHIRQCERAGYIEVGRRFIDQSVEIIDLSFSGHAALDSVRNPEVHRRAKLEWLSSVRDGLVSATVSGFFSFAAEIAKTALPG